MSAKRIGPALVSTAAGVLRAGMEQGNREPYSLAFCLYSACMLQSPETAAERERLEAEIARLRARVAELETAPLTVWRASHDSIPMGQYRSAREARAHCEDMVRCETPPGVGLAMEWWTDPDEPRVSELDAYVGGEHQATGYYVTALTVEAVYDPDGPEDHGVDEDPVPVALTDAAAEALAERRSWEDPHDSPLHHDHALGRDLPEPGVTP